MMSQVDFTIFGFTIFAPSNLLIFTKATLASLCLTSMRNLQNVDSIVCTGTYEAPFIVYGEALSTPDGGICEH